jgi:hypothetical protein
LAKAGHSVVPPNPLIKSSTAPFLLVFSNGIPQTHKPESKEDHHEETYGHHDIPVTVIGVGLTFTSMVLLSPIPAGKGHKELRAFRR